MLTRETFKPECDRLIRGTSKQNGSHCNLQLLDIDSHVLERHVRHAWLGKRATAQLSVWVPLKLIDISFIDMTTAAQVRNVCSLRPNTAHAKILISVGRRMETQGTRGGSEVCARKGNFLIAVPDPCADIDTQEQAQLSAIRAQKEGIKNTASGAERDFEGGFGGQEDLEDRYATTSGEH